MLWNIITKNKKLSKTLPEFKRSLVSVYSVISFALYKIDICNFADHTTPYVCDSNLKAILQKLEHNSELAIARF